MKANDEKIRQLNETIERDAENDREKYDTLLKSKEKMQTEYEEKKSLLKGKHEQNKRTIESDYKQKISLEIQRFEELEKEKNKELKDFDTFRYEYEEKFQREIFDKKNYYEEQLMREKALRDKILNEKQEILDDYNKKHDVLEDVAEEKIEKLKEENEETIKKITDNMEKAHGNVLIFMFFCLFEMFFS